MKKFAKNGNKYIPIDSSRVEDFLEPGRVYTINVDQNNNFYLEDIGKLNLPEKIYSFDSDFINHVLKEWENSDKKTTGVALIGEKGMGKSLTANLIAYKSNLPIIRINKKLPIDGIESIINNIPQDFCLLIDEFEKTFSFKYDEYTDQFNTEDQELFLSILDGSGLDRNRMLFIITGNQFSKLSTYFLNRPSRLRYVKKYKELTKENIKYIVDDLLEEDSFKEDLLTTLPISVINIDVLVEIIKEINKHKVPYSHFKDFFNFSDNRNVKIEVYAKIGEFNDFVTELSGDVFKYDERFIDINIAGWIVAVKVKKIFGGEIPSILNNYSKVVVKHRIDKEYLDLFKVPYDENELKKNKGQLMIDVEFEFKVKYLSLNTIY